ncbi:MAG TPA: enoyl-CoA hydratase/isomerase family protein, partial [Terrimicrobiaceae bacterium]|nr:enoyl-CoA hydratase/isomerase family protein [Terrimicrobiaceae bacterium]
MDLSIALRSSERIAGTKIKSGLPSPSIDASAARARPAIARTGRPSHETVRHVNGGSSSRSVEAQCRLATLKASITAETADAWQSSKISTATSGMGVSDFASNLSISTLPLQDGSVKLRPWTVQRRPGDAQEREPMTYRFLKVEIQGPAAWIEYDNPPRNAVNWELLQELPLAIRSSELDPTVRVIVIASRFEQYFSVGADLSLFDGIDQEGMRRWMEHCHGLVYEMRRASKPLLAAIAGVAVGAGFEATLHCDLRFAADTARFGQPEIKIGLLPGVGATQAFARLIGRPRAIRFLYEGTLIDAEAALSIG